LILKLLSLILLIESTVINFYLYIFVCKFVNKIKCFEHFLQAITWGLAFELLGETALKYLNDRECTKGGYETLITTFFPRNGVMTPFPVLVFRATEHNPQVILFSFII
jgi:hypothetical protein